MCIRDSYTPTVEETAAPSYETWVPTTAPPSYLPSSAPTAAPAAPTTPPSTRPTPAPSYRPTPAPIPSPTKTEAPTKTKSKAPASAEAAILAEEESASEEVGDDSARLLEVFLEGFEDGPAGDASPWGSIAEIVAAGAAMAGLTNARVAEIVLELLPEDSPHQGAYIDP